MNVLDALKEHEREIKSRFGVKKIGVFGSFAREEQREGSDVDLVVEFEKPSFDNFMDPIFYLEDLLEREVNVLTAEGVKEIRVKEVADEIRRSIVYA